MLGVKSIVFRYLTNTDFFNINKPGGTEAEGGGQTYIDFPAGKVPFDAWNEFLVGIRGKRTITRRNGTGWSLPIYSVGSDKGSQRHEIYPRRPQTMIIADQRLSSDRQNRVRAWHPTNRFPTPKRPTDRTQCPEGLVVFLASTTGGQMWAGWHLRKRTGQGLVADSEAKRILFPMLGRSVPKHGFAGVVRPAAGQLLLDPLNRAKPFQATNDYESSRANELFEFDLVSPHSRDSQRRRVTRVRKRNAALARRLKEFYGHQCQLTGTEYLFKKADGENYTEVHHLVPLGEDGADDPRNMVVLSAHAHRMLHHAKVEPIDLSQIKTNRSGTAATLDLRINGKKYTMRWRPEHAALFMQRG